MAQSRASTGVTIGHISLVFGENPRKMIVKDTSERFLSNFISTPYQLGKNKFTHKNQKILRYAHD